MHKSEGDLLNNYEVKNIAVVYAVEQCICKFLKIIHQFHQISKKREVHRRQFFKLAVIRSLFKIFVVQLPMIFIGYENIIIDGQLVPFLVNFHLGNIYLQSQEQNSE